MTIEVDEMSLSRAIGPRMDLLVLTTSRHDNNHKISKIVLQNVTVLASTLTETISTRGERDLRSMRVTLQVTPAEAKRLELAESEGKLQLVNSNRDNQQNK